MSSKHHWAALRFLWAFFKIVCVSAGCVGAFIGVVAFGHWLVEVSPWQLWAVFWPTVGVTGLYGLGYALSVEQEEYEQAGKRWEEERAADDPQ